MSRRSQLRSKRVPLSAPGTMTAEKPTLTAPIEAWHLGDSVLSMEGKGLTIAPNDTANVTLQVAVNDALKLWSGDSPNLYGLEVKLSQHAGSRLITNISVLAGVNGQ